LAAIVILQPLLRLYHCCPVRRPEIPTNPSRNREFPLSRESDGRKQKCRDIKPFRDSLINTGSKPRREAGLGRDFAAVSGDIRILDSFGVLSGISVKYKIARAKARFASEPRCDAI
jgi:hypothetical protein